MLVISNLASTTMPYRGGRKQVLSMNRYSGPVRPVQTYTCFTRNPRVYPRGRKTRRANMALLLPLQDAGILIRFPLPANLEE